MAMELGDNGAKAAATQAFLEDPESLARLAGTDNDQAAWIEAETVKADAVRETGFACSSRLDDPQEGPAINISQAGEDGGCKAGGDGAVPSGLAADLMQGIAAETAGQQPVESVDPQGKNGRLAEGCSGGVRRDEVAGGRRAAFDLGDPPLETGHPILCHEAAGRHGIHVPVICSYFVLIDSGEQKESQAADQEI